MKFLHTYIFPPLLQILTILALIVLFIPGILYIILLVVIGWGKDYFATGDFDEDFTH